MALDKENENQPGQNPGENQPGENQQPGQNEGASPAEGAKPESNVPYDRFQKVITERNEAKAKLDKLEKTQKEAEEKKLKEQKKFEELYQKTQKDLQEKTAEVTKEKRLNKTIIEAKKLNIVDPEAAFLFIQGKIDEKNEKGSVETLLKDLVKEKPYLVKKEDSGYKLSGNPPGGEGGIDQKTIENMTNEQYRAYREKKNKA